MTGVQTCALPISSTSGVVTFGGSPFLHNFGSSNTFVGENSGNFSLTGTGNTGVGLTALNADTTGAVNTAVGDAALLSNTTGGSNTAIGVGALQSNTTGTFNTAVGRRAGVTVSGTNANTTGSNNTFLGFQAGPGTTSQLTNATAIGANALVSQSNSIVLGNGSVNVGIGTQTPAVSLQVSDAVQGKSQILTSANGGEMSLYSFSADNSALSFDSDLVGGILIARHASVGVVEKLGGFVNIRGSSGNTSGTSAAVNHYLDINLSNGNVGLGNQSPSQRLDVVGNGNFSGSVTAASFSGSGAGLSGVSQLGTGASPVNNSFFGAETFSADTNPGPAVSITQTNGGGRGLDVTGTTTGQLVLVTQSGFGKALQVNHDGANATAMVVQATDPTTSTISLLGNNESNSGTAIWGSANNTSGNTVGVRGEAFSPTGIAVLGLGQASSGSATGVVGQSNNSQAGIGVRGSAISTGVSGAASGTSGVGVSGSASDTFGATIGVLGTVNSASGAAGVFNNLQNGSIIVAQRNSINKFVLDGDGNVATFGIGNITATGNVSGVNGNFTVLSATNPNVAGTAVVAHASNTSSGLEFGVDATMDGTFGGAVRGIATNASATAAIFQNSANGPVLSARNSSDTAVLLVDATNGVTVGVGSTPIVKHISVISGTLIFGSNVAPQTCSDQTVIISGVNERDSVAIGVPALLANTTGVTFSAWVSAAGVVTVRACNVSVGTANIGSDTVRIDVWIH